MVTRLTGELEDSIAPSLANLLEASFAGKRRMQLCGSLSESVLSASMWDRYANGHRGFAAGYSIEEFAIDYSLSRDNVCTQGYKALLAPVAYGERLDLSKIAPFADVLGPNDLTVSNYGVLLLVLSSLQKAKEWEHEREWRVITYSCSSEAKAFYCAVKPDSVYIGSKMDDDERARVIDVGRRNGWLVYEVSEDIRSADWSMKATLLPA